MPTFSPEVKYKRADGLYQVQIRVTHKRKNAYIPTDKLVDDDHISGCKVTDPYVLEYCMRRIVSFMERLNKHDIEHWTVQDIVRFLKSGDADVSFSDYARLHYDRMVAAGQKRNARNYEMAYNHLERYAGTNQLMFSRMTSQFVNEWIRSLSTTKRAKEMYPICIRQIFKAAMLEYNDYDTGVIRIKTNPWGKVKIPQADRAEKRAISPEECRLFFAAPMPDTKMLEPLPELGRDVAKMVLCLAGMNTVDLYELRKENYRDGKLCYKRAKTMKSRTDDAYIEMRVEPIIQPLVEKYLAEADDPYLFNFHNRYCDSDSFCANVNNGIKQVCRSMGIPQEKWYCVYTFRHTWGTVAQNDCGASIAEVGFAMNHSHRHTITRGYIKIDFTPAWTLNAKVIDFIFFSTAKSKQGMANEASEPKEKLFRISAKNMIYARAYFKGEVLAEVSDIGFSTIDAVIARLTADLPDTIPHGCAVQFRIKNVDTDREAVYERTKGKGF